MSLCTPLLFGIGFCRFRRDRKMMIVDNIRPIDSMEKKRDKDEAK